MLPESVKQMHADGLISDHHLEKLAEVQGRMIAASGRSSRAIMDVIVSEVELSDFDEFDYAECAPELEEEKTASGVGHTIRQAGRWVKNVNPQAAIGVVGLGLLAGMGVHSAAKAIKGSRQRTRSLADIKAQHPELKKDKDTDRYFGVISEFAPSLAGNPTVAGNLIQKMKQWGAIDHKTVQDLIQMEKTHRDTNRGMSVMDAANVMSNVSSIARMALPDTVKERELGLKERAHGLKEREFISQRADRRVKRRHMGMQAMQDAERLTHARGKYPLEAEKLREEIRVLGTKGHPPPPVPPSPY